MSALDAARRLVVERNLVRAAFDHLTVDAFMALPFEALGPTKALLKRFFSDEPWTAADDASLATIVGPGEGTWQRDLDDDLVLEYGWVDARFGVRVTATTPSGQVSEPQGGPKPDQFGLAGTFDGPVVPEATPNPRTIRFQVGPVHDGPSRWFESAGAVGDDDPGVARLFREFDEVSNVLVGTDFVAVGLRRSGDWERLLRPVLAVVTEEFAADTPDADSARAVGPARVMGGPAGAGAGPERPSERGDGPERPSEPGDGPERPSEPGDGPERPSEPGDGPERHGHPTRLEKAWRDLGGLHPAAAADLEQVRAAAGSDDSSYRQVAANLLREADAAEAAGLWATMVTDPVRSVRRAAVDAMVDVDRQELRPVLEEALGDRDAWIRWKALRGLAQLGPEPSRAAIGAHADDPDFHVRLEVAAALRGGDPDPA